MAVAQIRYVRSDFTNAIETAATKAVGLSDIPEIKSVAEAFAQNLRRVSMLALFPMNICDHGRALGEENERHRMANAIARELHPNDPAAHNAEIEKRTKAISYPSSKWVTGTGVGLAPDFLQLCCTRQPELSTGMLVTLDSTLLCAWTAFEALATDLWVCAVNLRPSTLGRNAFKGAAQQAKGPEREAAGRLVDFDTLAQHDFNLLGRMGTVFYEKRMVSFNSLESITLAYKLAFEQRGKDLVEGVKDLSSLEAIRHLLIHRAGVVDKMFVTRVSRDKDLSLMKTGDRIQVDGPMATKYSAAASNGGLELIGFVNTWLSKK